MKSNELTLVTYYTREKELEIEIEHRDRDSLLAIMSEFFYRGELSNDGFAEFSKAYFTEGYHSKKQLELIKKLTVSELDSISNKECSKVDEIALAIFGNKKLEGLQLTLDIVNGLIDNGYSFSNPSAVWVDVLTREDLLSEGIESLILKKALY